MRKSLYAILVMMAVVFMSCEKQSDEQYLYRFSADTHFINLDHLTDVSTYLSSVGFVVDDTEIFGGTESKCNKQAKEWFENTTKGIDTKKLESMMDKGEYYNIKVVRYVEEDVKIIAKKDFSGK